MKIFGKGRKEFRCITNKYVLMLNV